MALSGLWGTIAARFKFTTLLFALTPIKTGWGLLSPPQTQAAKSLIAIPIPITAKAAVRAMQAFHSALPARNWTPRRDCTITKPDTTRQTSGAFCRSTRLGMRTRSTFMPMSGMIQSTVGTPQVRTPRLALIGWRLQIGN